MTERAGVQGNPVTQHTIPAAEPGPPLGTLHHVELWVPDLARATAQWGWLLGQLGYAPFQDWPAGRSWRLGHTYLVIEQSPAPGIRLTDTVWSICSANTAVPQISVRSIGMTSGAMRPRR